MKKVLILLLWLLPSCSVVIFAQTQRIAGTVVVGDGQPAVGSPKQSARITINKIAITATIQSKIPK